MLFLSYHDAIMNKRMYRVEGTNNVFRMFWKYGIATCAELRGGWSWINDKRYYEWVERDDTIFTNPVPLLKNVCLYDPTISIKYILSGSYSLFLRHGLKAQHNFVERVSFRVSINARNYETNKVINSQEIYFVEKFMTMKDAKNISNKFSQI